MLGRPCGCRGGGDAEQGVHNTEIQLYSKGQSVGPNKIGNVYCAFIFSAFLSENLFCKMCLVSSILPDGFLSEAVC